MRSAKMAKRGLCKEALCIKSTICAKRVDCPTCSTRTRTVWLTLCEPAITDSPMLRRKGLDSPVSKASSTKVSPCRMLASAGKTSAGRTSKTSPTRTSSVATTSNDCWVFKRRTVSGKRLMSDSKEPAVFSRKRASSQRPVSKKNTNMVMESK